MVWVLQALPHQPVVVDLAIDSEGNAIIRVGKRLSSTLNAHNTQTFMRKDWYASEHISSELGSPLTCVVGNIRSRPVWTTVPALLGHFQRHRLECLCIRHMVTTHDATHAGQGNDWWGRDGDIPDQLASIDYSLEDERTADSTISPYSVVPWAKMELSW